MPATSTYAHFRFWEKIVEVLPPAVETSPTSRWWMEKWKPRCGFHIKTCEGCHKSAKFLISIVWRAGRYKMLAGEGPDSRKF